jgi:hypothetical protein
LESKGTGKSADTPIGGVQLQATLWITSEGEVVFGGQPKAVVTIGELQFVHVPLVLTEQ